MLAHFLTTSCNGDAVQNSRLMIPNKIDKRRALTKLQSCTKLVGTHALLIIITFIIKMYVYKMTSMIQYPCSKHASSPSLPHQALLVYTCLLFIPSALSLTILILGSGEHSFYYTMSQQFRTRLYPTAEKIKYQNQKMSHKIQTRCRNYMIFARNNL